MAIIMSVAIIPLMIRLAPRLRLLDHPNARKVHERPIPRVGGWGITIGALAAVLLSAPVGPLATGFLIGGAILLIAGAADDMFDLPGKLKLCLQIAAAVPVVLVAGLALKDMPLSNGLALPFAIGMPASALAIIVCINATNTSDGLDGLAAGATLLSLFGVLYMAFILQSAAVLQLTAAALGGLAGFLRFNTHPAMIFMGDLGSQFLGFTVGFLCLALLSANPNGVSPWALLLICGLPVADIVVVAVRRLIANQSLFKADKSHIHHRLLDLGFSHPESVVIFYTAQSLFVFFGVAMRTSEVWQIVLVYTVLVVLIYGFLHISEAIPNGKRPQRQLDESVSAATMESRIALLWAPRLVLETVLPVIFVAAALAASEVTWDFGLLGLAMLILLVIRFFSEALRTTSATRIPIFLLAAGVLYLYTNNRPLEGGLVWLTETTLVTVLAAMTFVAVKFSPKRRKEEFHPTSIDYLLVVFAVMAIIALRTIPAVLNPYFLIYLPVVLYASELLLIERRQRTNWLPHAATAAAAILAIRGFWSIY